MSKELAITDTIKKMYMQYPFPDIDYRIDYGLSIMRFLKSLNNLRPGFWENARVLEAGCGTGSTLNQLAKHFPSAKFLGVDLSTTSLEKAKEKSSSSDLNNIEFRSADILEMDLDEKPFDVILCIGVLHHLADMEKGLDKLVDHLKEDGIILLWLNGKYGRFRLNLNQRLFSKLLQNIDNMEDKINIVKTILKKADKKYVECHFNVPYSKIENDFDKSLEFIFEHPQWLVDQFLNVKEKVLEMEDILSLADNSNLRLLRWLNVKEDISSYVEDQAVARLYNKLDERDKLICLDLLIKPNYYTIALEKSG